ncbi:hypothetical protein CcCBS67573_g06860 [Chytriomyces confervae]|uniref:ABC1 atypical kinase-like domain-containing protein n=1 Tax=Chytriomyces confervae TaxID=246404 RepID=A0A507F1E5_9FUNG|nr:hypothetical protein CcCBS67573_g06860 [Chytriomyces confervae]
MPGFQSAMSKQSSCVAVWKTCSHRLSSTISAAAQPPTNPFPRISSFAHRFALASASGPKLPRFKRPSRRFVSLTVFAIGASAFALSFLYPDQIEWINKAGTRASRVVWTSLSIAADYKWALRSGVVAELQKADEVDGTDRLEELYSVVHRRSAEKMLRVFQQNGGVYIKLGQHLNALVYLLPFEYTDTFKVLQDQCPPTPMKSVREVILSETGSELEELFENFDETPIGVASLAQVHYATLKSNKQQPVAIKIQHPELQSDAPMDTALCAFIVRAIKPIFPEFELTWLAEEMAVALPQELDFRMEAANIETVRGNFRGDAVFFVPNVFWATKRILVEEFVHGVKVDNLDAMKVHAIDPLDISEVLSRIFSKMLFWDGFVHCDPHPGNIIIRPRTRSWYEFSIISKLLGLNPYNFEMVLLDHGLYRSIPSSLRLDFCHLWIALIRFDEGKVKHYAGRIFEVPTRTSSITESKKGLTASLKGIDPNIDPHRLFASMLTGRPWNVIAQEGSKEDTNAPSTTFLSDMNASSAGLASLRTQHEKTTVIQKVAKRKFLSAITKIMAVLPREVLLIIKTNDILRSVDRRLGVTGSAGGGKSDKKVGCGGGDTSDPEVDDQIIQDIVGKRMVRRFAWMVWYCSVAIRDERMQRAENLIQWGEAWMDSFGVLVRLLVMEVIAP